VRVRGSRALRLHFPSIRQGTATVYELVDAIAHFLTSFSLPRSQIMAVDALYGEISVDEFKLKFSQMSETARALFRRANETTNRNGEAGELLLYLLTEWILEAPQLIAKMSLKTNRDVPVHGADGVHVRYCPETSRLFLYWGEAKFYANVNEAISAASASFAAALSPEKLNHELNLVQRNIDFSGLGDTSKAALLRYLDPFDEAYNERHDIITCLIGFNFNAFDTIAKGNVDTAERDFVALALDQLATLASTLSTALKTANLETQKFEIFFFPVPSVQELRDLFQAKIGWKQ
jgi:hypothetical protein